MENEKNKNELKTVYVVKVFTWELKKAYTDEREAYNAYMRDVEHYDAEYCPKLITDDKEAAYSLYNKLKNNLGCQKIGGWSSSYYLYDIVEIYTNFKGIRITEDQKEDFDAPEWWALEDENKNIFAINEDNIDFSNDYAMAVFDEEDEEEEEDE